MTIHKSFAISAAALALLATAVLGGPARAEPQALGLVATDEPAQMQCQFGRCDVFLSAFCLEQKRHPPMRPQAYLAGPGAEITLVVETRDGRTLRLKGQDWLAFETNNAYTSVLAYLPEARLAALDPAHAAVEVGPLASLLPRPVAGDPTPHTDAEIELAMNGYRKAAEAFFGTGSEKAGMLAATTRLINDLPRVGAAPKALRDKVIRDATRGAAAGTVARCEAASVANSRLSLRFCLELEHRQIQIDTNESFWNSLAGV
ncbi:MAG: hypothetical protein QF654_08880 [Alphaproteobacteria bacterium]|jgi:hypothetical protein|nr:hypothetical protein [Alphaproteobacteria bacterium]